MIGLPQRRSTTLAWAFIGTSTSVLKRPNTKPAAMSKPKPNGSPANKGDSASGQRGDRAGRPQRRPGAAEFGRQQAGDRHGGQGADAAAEQGERELRVGQPIERLDAGNRDRPGADRKAVGEEDGGDAHAGGDVLGIGQGEARAAAIVAALAGSSTASREAPKTNPPAGARRGDKMTASSAQVCGCGDRLPASGP